MTSPDNDLLTRLVRAGLEAADSRDRAAADMLTRIAVLLTANAIAAGPNVMPGLRRAARDKNGAALLAEGVRLLDPAEAAAGNAAAITATQCDDGLREARGHPGLHAYAAALAAIEDANGSVADFRRAFHAGWEIGARLGLLLGTPRPGIHPHGGWGAGAAAAATAVALQLEPDAVAAAVATALVVALTGPDSTATDGTSAHYLLPGFGTASGMRAAWHIAGGGGPPTTALQHFARVAHMGTLEAADAVLGSEPLIEDAYTKPIGFCAHALTTWAAVTRLELPSTTDIANIEVITYAAAAQLDEREPQSLLARRFSIPWAVGCALTGCDIETDDEQVASLARLTVVTHAAELDGDYPTSRPAHVRVRLTDGTSVEGFARFHPGDREEPLDARAQAQVVMNLVQDAALAERLLDFATTSLETPLRAITTTWLTERLGRTQRKEAASA